MQRALKLILVYTRISIGVCYKIAVSCRERIYSQACITTTATAFNSAMPISPDDCKPVSAEPRNKYNTNEQRLRPYLALVS